MPRQELHSDSLHVEQKPPIMDMSDRGDEIVLVDGSLNSNYADELAFNEEPVTIRLEPSSDKNAAQAFPVWVNGKGAEVFQAGQWQEIGYLPVGRVLIIKRKYLAVIIGAKIDTIHTEVREPDSEHPHNVVQRFTSPVHSFSIIEDKNPKGPAWVTELRRRNL